jgi:hypothetical protein
MFWAIFLKLRELYKNLEETYNILYQLNPDKIEAKKKELKKIQDRKGSDAFSYLIS